MAWRIIYGLEPRVTGKIAQERSRVLMGPSLWLWLRERERRETDHGDRQGDGEETGVLGGSARGVMSLHTGTVAAIVEAGMSP